MGYDNSSVEISCRVIHETDSAVLVDAGLEENVWIPRSQLVNFESNCHNEDEYVTIEVAEWFAQQKELI